MTADPRCRRLSQLLPVLAVEDRLTPGGGRSWDLYMSTLEAIRVCLPVPLSCAPARIITLLRGASDGQGDLRSTAGDSAVRKLCESSFARKANAVASRIAGRSIQHFIFYLDAVSHDEEAGRMSSSGNEKISIHKSMKYILKLSWGRFLIQSDNFNADKYAVQKK